MIDWLVDWLFRKLFRRTVISVPAKLIVHTCPPQVKR